MTAGWRTPAAVPVVVVKKRRQLLLPAGDVPSGATTPQDEEKRPRVYQLQAATPRPPAEAPAEAVGAAVPRKRRRGHRDPAHAPGQVHRVVFETALPPQAAEPVPSGPLDRLFVQPPSGYEQVMAGLRGVRAALHAARSARQFRVI